MFNEKAEKLNGRAAMIGFIAAVGAYFTTGQVLPGIWWNKYLLLGTGKMALLATVGICLATFVAAAMMTQDGGENAQS